MRWLGFVLLTIGGCAYPIRSCGTAIGWVQATVCADSRYSECLLPFAKPIPSQGCWMVVDPHGPAERPVICVASCKRG